MKRLIYIMVVLIPVSMSAQAQTWGERQKIYSEKANLETELFHQREEIERMKLENERAIKDQRREIEQQRYQLDRLEKIPPLKHTYPDVEILEPHRMDNEKLLEKLSRQQKTAEIKALVERKSKDSLIVFDEKYYLEAANNMAEKGISAENISRLLYGLKAMWLRIEDDALKGNAIDQRKLAIAYFEGKDIKSNYGQAIKWLTSAAENGDAGAQAYFGYLYSNGTIIPKNEKLSADWYMKAAQQEYPEAQFMMGGLYLLGRGVTQDNTKSYEWFRRAADRGYGDAQYVLGLRYHYGELLPKDDLEAAFWFRLASLNHANYLKEPQNTSVPESVIENLLPSERIEVERRVTNWAPIRTKAEQEAFDRMIASQDNLIITRLRGLHFNSEQAARILSAYKDHLFQGGKARSIEGAQMIELFERAEAKLKNVKTSGKRHEEVTQQLTSELTGK